MNKFYKKGFTLIELLVVVSIISMLSGVVLSSVEAARSKARDAQRLSDLRQIKNALALYANDHGGSYPPGTSGSQNFGSFSSCGGATAPCSSVTYLSDPLFAPQWSNLASYLVPKYIPSLPVDPLNGTNGYRYKYMLYGAGTLTVTDFNKPKNYVLNAYLENSGNSFSCGSNNSILPTNTIDNSSPNPVANQCSAGANMNAVLPSLARLITDGHESGH